MENKKTNYNGREGFQLFGMIFGICAIIIIICIAIMALNSGEPKELNKVNPLNNDNTMTEQVAKNMQNLTLEYSDTREYENIYTYIYHFIDEDKNPVNLSEGYIGLDSIITTVNSELANITNEVCSIGIVGSMLYIQTDIRHQVTEPMKMNIITLKDNLGGEDWLKLTEAVQNTVHVYTDTHINYTTELGNRHYLYVYSDIAETVDNVTEASDIISSIPVEDNVENNVN